MYMMCENCGQYLDEADIIFRHGGLVVCKKCYDKELGFKRCLCGKLLTRDQIDSDEFCSPECAKKMSNKVHDIEICQECDQLFYKYLIVTRNNVNVCGFCANKLTEEE